MSNRPKSRRYSPEVAGFIADARVIGFVPEVTDRQLADLAGLLVYGFAAPDATDEMLVQDLVSHEPTFGDINAVRGLVASARVRLVGVGV